MVANGSFFNLASAKPHGWVCRYWYASSLGKEPCTRQPQQGCLLVRRARMLPCSHGEASRFLHCPRDQQGALLQGCVQRTSAGEEQYLEKDASIEEIRKAYLRAALRWHPDKNPEEQDFAETMFKRVAQAYKVLSDDLLRSSYNTSGEGGLGHDWWPDDPEASRDMAYQFFIHRVPGKSLIEGFSEAKLREIFPHLFGRGRVMNKTKPPERSPL
eukprot:s562_g19.t2